MRIYNNYNFSYGKTPSKSLQEKRAENPQFRAWSFFNSNKVIKGQENCWKLHNPDDFNKFIRNDKDLMKSVKPILDLFDKEGVKPKVSMFVNFKKNGADIGKFFDLVKSKYGINLEIPPKIYRFVSEREVIALNRDGKVEPNRNGMRMFDVTTNPELNWNEYRITFKPLPKFSVLDKNSLMRENPGCNHEHFYHFLDSYSLSDIEKIEYLRK